MDKLQIENWKQLAKRCDFSNLILQLEENIRFRTFLVNDSLTEADQIVYSTLIKNAEFMNDLKNKAVSSNIERYVNFLSSLPDIKNYVKSQIEKPRELKKPKEVAQEKLASNVKFEEGGMFIPLKNAEKGKVVVRFPPEASGYLHIGHAKAALINQHYKDNYDGKLIMRFDDTNPAKESEEFEKIILEDVKSLGITYDALTYTSDYFDELMNYCDQLIISNNAYADNTDSETMRKEREQCIISKCRNQSVDENMTLWKEMKAGTKVGEKYCIRIKMDMQSKNGCMRDPTIYRCKKEKHIRTGDKYNVYPTYDFACPIVDSIEGVTHTLRTSEYNDRNEQFYRILDMLNLRKPEISDYSRLSLQNTVLSKRKLTWIVNQGYVSGWDDPRMPTVRGILRHGLTIEGLKEFILSQGFGRSVVFMEWDKIWAFNKKVIDAIVPRYTGILAGGVDHVVVHVAGQNSVTKSDVAKHPKNPEIGNKSIWFSPHVLVEKIDAADFVEETNVTFINWGNLKINKINKSKDGTVESVNAELNLDDKDFKKTQKVTWLPLGENEERQLFDIPVSTVYYDSLISKSLLDKDDDFKQYVNKESKEEICLYGDIELANLKKGDIVQLQRKGYFICDEEYGSATKCGGREYPLVLINIPEGNKKERPAGGAKKVDKSNTAAVEKSKSGDGAKNEKTKKKENKAQESKEKIPKGAEFEEPTDISVDANLKKQTRLGLEVSMADSFPQWYIEVITKSEMIEYYDISGCYILRPWACEIWDNIQSYLNRRFKALGVKKCYFPLFVSKSNLNKEKDHIADFSPEVAWVTKSGDTEMKEHIAIRPTSETVMYPYYAKWIKSHRDLPLKLNQWCNVVRWEFKQPTPFLRTREFLWQEGHTAYSNRADAEKEVYEILDIYADVYEDLLAIPCIKGRKTEKEKFPGGDFTTTTEVYIAGSGRGIQGATSHHLGQNFSKMYDIRFTDKNQSMEYAHQNSWGMTTRTIGVAVMVHGDDKGVVLPPRVADVQVVIIPCGITVKSTDDDKQTLLDKCNDICQRLESVGVRVVTDLDDNRLPGWKFNQWELKGVPIRLEIGPKDLVKQQVVLCYRYNGVKESIPDESVEKLVPEKLDTIHKEMFAKAKRQQDDHIITAYNLKDLSAALDKKMLILAPFCGDRKCEDSIKEISAGNAVVEEGAPAMGAKSLCIPLDQPAGLGNKCVREDCENKPLYFTLFGRSY